MKIPCMIFFFLTTLPSNKLVTTNAYEIVKLNRTADPWSFEYHQNSDEARTSKKLPPLPPNVNKHPRLPLVNRENCGISSNHQPFIFGGSKTHLFEYPWMALIGYIADDNERPRGSSVVPVFRCSGTIINRRYVLTAAHCLVDLPKGMKVSFVRVGEYNLNRMRDCERLDEGTITICANEHQDIGIESTHSHKGYSDVSWRNDVALIRLNATLKFENQHSVLPICLPLNATFRIATTTRGSTVTATGWGVTSLGSQKSLSPKLMRAELALQPLERCSRAFANRLFVKLWHKQICAGGNGSTGSTCTGDSGGPLQTIVSLPNGETRIVQIAVISFGLTECSGDGAYGVYTDLAYYVDWILDQLTE
ncbi:serine protease easter [Copidosoma floridanum]|uniref:serine protease easter n=1 Tax=Copidosoma floridanum TaxID=29053 RepID=UPI0006C95120|nr:serine protease easter [Copidosoma floridanum]